MNKHFKPVLYSLIFVYLISIIGLIILREQPEYFRISWIFTALSFLVLMLFHSPHTFRFWVLLIMSGLFGFFIEIIGVKTGLVFGSYTYGESLGIKLWETPIIMIVNWMMLPYMVFSIMVNTKFPTLVKVFFSSIILTGFDFIMEPVAMKLDMWKWEEGYPPFQNSIGWFVVSFVVFQILFYSKIRIENKLASYLLITQVVFFGMLNLLFSIWK